MREHRSSRNPTTLPPRPLLHPHALPFFQLGSSLYSFLSSNRVHSASFLLGIQSKMPPKKATKAEPKAKRKAEPKAESKTGSDGELTPPPTPAGITVRYLIAGRNTADLQASQTSIENDDTSVEAGATEPQPPPAKKRKTKSTAKKTTTPSIIYTPLPSTLGDASPITAASEQGHTTSQVRTESIVVPSRRTDLLTDGHTRQ